MHPARPISTYAASALALCAVACLASPAHAEYIASEAPLGAPSELTIDLRGRVDAHCEMTTPPRAGDLRLERAGASDRDFRLNCNAPFTMKVKSANGGMTSDGSVLSDAVPYEIGMRVGTDRGQRDLGWCQSAALAIGGACAFGSQGWSSGTDTAIDQAGRMRLRWRDPAKLSGGYRDTIVIELEVRS